jgi:hypothetical protein
MQLSSLRKEKGRAGEKIVKNRTRKAKAARFGVFFLLEKLEKALVEKIQNLKETLNIRFSG